MRKIALMVMIAALCGNFGGAFAATEEIVNVGQAGIVVSGPIVNNAYAAIADFSLSVQSGDPVHVDHIGITGVAQYGAFNFNQVQLYELGNDGSLNFAAQGEIYNAQNSVAVIFRNFEFDGYATYIMYGTIGDSKGGPAQGLATFSLTDFAAYDMYDGVEAVPDSYSVLEQMQIRPQAVIPTVKAELAEPGIVRSVSTGAVVRITLENALNPSDIRFALVGQGGAYQGSHSTWIQGSEQYEQVRFGNEIPTGSYQILAQVMINGVYWSAMTENFEVVPPLQILGCNRNTIVGGNLFIWGESFNDDYPMEVAITSVEDPSLQQYFQTQEVWNGVNGGFAIIQAPAYMMRYSGKGNSAPERMRTPIGRYRVQLSGFAGYDSIEFEIIDPGVVMETKLVGQTIPKGTKLKLTLDVIGYDSADLVFSFNTGLSPDTRSTFTMLYGGFGPGRFVDMEIDTSYLPFPGNWEIQIQGKVGGYVGNIDTTGVFTVAVPTIPVPSVPVVVSTDPPAPPEDVPPGDVPPSDPVVSEATLTVTYVKGEDGLWKQKFDVGLFKESGLIAKKKDQLKADGPMTFKATPFHPKGKK